MNLIEQFGEYNLTNKKNREIKYIVIHYTAGTTSKAGTAKSTAKYFNKETTKASADFIVDDEFVVQYNPDIKNKYCWHCGGSKYNTKGGSLYKIATSANSIGIEVCSTNDTKKVTSPNDEHWSFTDIAIKNTIELVKQLMQEYDIDVEHIIRHYDCTGKTCPGIIGWNADTGDETKWLDFKNELIQNNKTTLTLADVVQEIEAADEIIEIPEVKDEEKEIEVKTQINNVKPIIKENKSFFTILLEAILNFF